MKKYMLFSGYFYYPSGGMHDFRGFFDTLDEVNAEVSKKNTNSFIRETEYDWYHYFDTETGKYFYWCSSYNEWQYDDKFKI